MCWAFCYVIGRGCLLWHVHSFGKILLAFALLHFVLQGQMCLLLQLSLDLLLLHAATAAAKSLQSCPTLCDPIDGSPPGSPVPGILQARTLLHTSPLWWKEHLFWVLVVEVLVVLHRTNQISLFRITGCGIFLYYSDIEWFALEMNRDHSVIFEIALKYCISDSFVDCDGYSTSSKGFLPTTGDIMVIWIKFPLSGPF